MMLSVLESPLMQDKLFPEISRDEATSFTYQTKKKTVDLKKIVYLSTHKTQLNI